MTSHRLIRCSLAAVLIHGPAVWGRHTTASVTSPCPGWRYHDDPPPGRSVT